MEDYQNQAFAETVFQALVNIHCDGLAKEGVKTLYAIIQEFELRDGEAHNYLLHIGPEEISSAVLVEERYITDDLVLRRNNFIGVGDHVVLDELDGEYSHRFDVIDGRITPFASYEFGDLEPYNSVNFKR